MEHFNVTFVFDYGSLTVTVQSDHVDQDIVAQNASELFRDQYGFDPIASASDYGVWSLA